LRSAYCGGINASAEPIGLTVFRPFEIRLSKVPPILRWGSRPSLSVPYTLIATHVPFG